MRKDFEAQIAKALENPNLGGALGRFSEAYRTSRAKAYTGIDFEALRGEIARVKGSAAGQLDALAERFKAAAEARGAVVYRTSSPEDVRRYILELAAARGVKHVVKSKSMATEEIHLNAALKGAGIDVQETDLGEWIIQLAGQRPSHMVMPAIHMTKEEVAEIFSKEVEERLAADIPRLVKVAREQLRPRFLGAEMGISGANVAVAETGTLAIMTNEGNARLVTTLPRIHVAVVGLEKLVEKMEDVVPILRALPKSATGQLLTSYLTFITGPVPTTEGEPKELHIVLMDNRRTDMSGDPAFKQALQCIRCASCLNVCPVFRIVGGHVFGKVYTGGIGTILTAWFDALEASDEIQGLCIGCGACADVCPGKIDIPELILELRRRLAKKKGLGAVQKGVFAVVNNRRVFHAMLRAASVAQKPFAKGGFIRHLPFFLSDVTKSRALPAIAARPLRDTIRDIAQPAAASEKIAFYSGCLIDFAYPEMGESVVRILNKAGIRVVFPEGQTCCGAPARYSGAFDVAAKNAADNIEALLAEDVTHVVSACPTCTVALTREFASSLEAAGRQDLLPKARALAAKAIDFSTLVKKLVDQGRLTFKEGQDLGKITYHDSCHLARTLRVHDQPRELLTRAGAQITEMPEADVCCGMGGSYSVKLPQLSAPMLARKLQHVEQAGAPKVAMDCPGCVMQIRGGLHTKGSDVAVMHTAQLIEKSLR